MGSLTDSKSIVIGDRIKVLQADATYETRSVAWVDESGVEVRKGGECSATPPRHSCECVWYQQIAAHTNTTNKADWSSLVECSMPDRARSTSARIVSCREQILKVTCAHECGQH